MYAPNKQGLVTRREYALNKQHTLNSEVHLTTRVYVIIWKGDWNTRHKHRHVCGVRLQTDKSSLH